MVDGGGMKGGADDAGLPFVVFKSGKVQQVQTNQPQSSSERKATLWCWLGGWLLEPKTVSHTSQLLANERGAVNGRNEGSDAQAT